LVEYNLCVVNVIMSDSFHPGQKTFFKVVTSDYVIKVTLKLLLNYCETEIPLLMSYVKWQRMLVLLQYFIY